MNRIYLLSKQCVGLLTCLLLLAATMSSCEEDGVNMRLDGRIFQGANILLGRGTATPIYSELIYHFISPHQVEVFSQEVKRVSTTLTTYGVIGPDTLDYIQNGETIEVNGYTLALKEGGLEMWGGSGMQCLMTERANKALDGETWMVAPANLPIDFPNDLQLEFTGGVMKMSSQKATVSPTPEVGYRAIGNAITGSFTMNGVEYADFVALFLNPTTMYTNIGGTGVAFLKVVE